MSKRNTPGPGQTCSMIVMLLICVLPVGAQVGKVGINTVAPLALLHVKDSSVLFTGPDPLPGAPGLPPVEGSGTRMMWYADKGAFRAGRVTGTQWNRDNIGLNSFGLGLNAMATNNYSTAIGQGTQATGDNATAIGRFATASGPSSVSIGESTDASGFGSIAFGFASGSPGYTSTSLGYGNTAYGDYSFATGYQNFGGGNYSFVFGEESSANGSHSTVGGQYSAADADFATVLGHGLYVTAYGSTTVGWYNYTSLDYSPDSWVSTDPLFVVGNGDGNDYTNALTVLKNGNVGIGPTDPVEKLEVDGSMRLGSNGSAIQEVIKMTVNHDVGMISGNATIIENFSVTDALPGSTVFVSPASSLPLGTGIAYSRVSAANNVQVAFFNCAATTQDPGAMDFYITVIR